MADIKNKDDPLGPDYDENEDEDFNPNAAPAADEDISSSSNEEDETAASKPAKRSKKRVADVVDAELDSGDEATIKEREGRKRKKRKEKDADEESGGEGGLIKTRAQRQAEKIERKERKRTDRGEVTVDVDSLWAELNALPVGRPHVREKVSQDEVGMDRMEQEGDATIAAPKAEELIKIKRRIEFAGEVTEVEEEVLKSSKEAQRYLAEHPEADPNAPQASASSTNGLQRPLRRPSIFEPNPMAIIKGVPADRLRPRAPSRVDVLMAEKRADEERRKKAEKMTTVQKSALDWKGFVSEQGLGEELDEYGKSKRGFLAREQFLDRVAGANESARKEARLKG